MQFCYSLHQNMLVNIIKDSGYTNTMTLSKNIYARAQKRYMYVAVSRNIVQKTQFELHKSKQITNFTCKLNSRILLRTLYDLHTILSNNRTIFMKKSALFFLKIQRFSLGSPDDYALIRASLWKRTLSYGTDAQQSRDRHDDMPNWNHTHRSYNTSHF